MLKGRVLLLNQDSKVLGTIGVARAIRMTLRQENPVYINETIPDPNCGCGKGVMCLKSGNGDFFPVPSVLSLKHYVNVIKKRQASGAKRLKIYLRDRYKCQYCSIGVGKMFTDEHGKKRKLEVKDLTLDHIKPKSKGGEATPENMVTACKPCNQRKADRTPDEAKMPLVTTIHETRDIGLDKVLICSYLEHRPEWRQYVEWQEGFKEALAMVA